MKILTLSPDGGDLFQANSALAERFIRYGDLVERFDVLMSGATEAGMSLSPHVHLHRVGGTTKISRFLGLCFALQKHLKHTSYDLLSTRDPYFLGLLTVLFARWYGLGIEIQVHGFEKLNFVRKLLARWVLLRADSVRAVSERLKTRLVREFGLAPHRIIVSPIFIDGRRFVEAGALSRSKEGQKNRPFTLLTVSRLVPIKRIELQLHALAQLVKKNDVRLIIVGDGPSRASLELLTTQLALEAHVTFAGTQKNIIPFLEQADVFLLTSDDEGYGLAPIEAACFGLPIVMTDVGCANEVIVDQKNGYIIPVGDEHRLAEVLQTLIEHPEQRAFFAKNNQQLQALLPTQEKTLALYKTSWEQAVNGRRT